MPWTPTSLSKSSFTTTHQLRVQASIQAVMSTLIYHHFYGWLINISSWVELAVMSRQWCQLDRKQKLKETFSGRNTVRLKLRTSTFRMQLRPMQARYFKEKRRQRVVQTIWLLKTCLWFSSTVSWDPEGKRWLSIWRSMISKRRKKTSIPQKRFNTL